MTPSTPAQWRHDLRTPLNHIIGYGEMLLEELDAPEPGSSSEGLGIALEATLTLARQVLARINTQLDAVAAEGGDVDPTVLAVALDEPVHALAGSCALLVASAAAGPARGDVDRIAAAVSTLQRLIGNGGVARPVAAAPQAATAATGAATVLVVDDDESNRDMLGRRIARDGHRVVLAAGGLEALAAVEAQVIDLILLDVMMPGLSGDEVLRQLKANPASAHVPVLMISALDETATVARCIERGAEDYLPKPFDPVILRARIGACLEKKRLRDTEAAQRRELDAWTVELERRVAEQLGLLERLTRLKRFFSPQLADLIVAGGADDPLRTHRREITVCFLDLRGFTAFADSVEPEEVMGVLREFHAEMGTLILAHEGTLERFTGDGMMIFFNDPVPVDDAAERVVRMALAMRERVAVLVQWWTRLGYELDLGIGIAQGYATIGAIGFEGRWDYGAIGSVTNLAARLCGEAQPGQILVAHRVAVQTEALAELRLVGSLTLRGFHRPVATYELLGPKTPD